jgi:hypothetical protein
MIDALRVNAVREALEELEVEDSEQRHCYWLKASVSLIFCPKNYI